MRKHMRALALAAALLALAAAGCRKQEMWPLQQGNEWVYHEHIQFGVAPTGEVRYVVRSVTQTPDGARAVIEAFRDDSPDPFQSMELIRTENGLYETSRTAYVFEDAVKFAFKPEGDAPPFILTNKPKEGQTWNFKYTAEDLTFGASAVFSGQGMIEGWEKINPKAGQFKTMRVALRAREENSTGFENRYYWFRRGVGPVRIEIQHANENTILMLIRARVGKKKIGKW